MKRKNKILKCVLLLRKFSRYETKEQQLDFVDRHYTDEMLDEWIPLLKNPNTENYFE